MAVSSRVIGRKNVVSAVGRNVPGVLSKINTVMAELGVNIFGQYLKTNDEIGYVVLDIAPTSDADRITDRLKAIPDTIRVRMLW